jgi:hypothetical protein
MVTGPTCYHKTYSHVQVMNGETVPRGATAGGCCCPLTALLVFLPNFLCLRCAGDEG